MESKRILIMAGGTGGHVFPALAVAKAIQQQGYQVYWLGTRWGFESKLVSEAGFPLYFISVEGVRGKGWFTRLTMPFRLMIALIQSLYIIHQLKPNVVLGMGGFASGPGGVAAWLLKVPLVIHEQNAVAGVTNRLLSHLARRVLEGFPHSFSSKKAIFIGNPVRQELYTILPPEERFKDRTHPIQVLVLGGSQGALALNKLCPQAFSLIPLQKRPFVKHQCGKNNLEATEKFYKEANVLARIEPFIEDMAQAYAWADIVICRAGALTVAELAQAGVGSILIPFPFAVDDHQTHNGRFLAEAGAAQVISQKLVNPQMLADIIINLSEDRAKLLSMADAAKTKARPKAVEEALKYCIEVGL